MEYDLNVGAGLYGSVFAQFNRFANSSVANYCGELYALPFNMYTFNRMWGVTSPQKAAVKIKEQKDLAEREL